MQIYFKHASPDAGVGGAAAGAKTALGKRQAGETTEFANRSLIELDPCLLRKASMFFFLLEPSKETLGSLKSKSAAVIASVMGALENGARGVFSATALHSLRVAEISEIIGKKMGLGEERMKLLWLAAMFHDVGKVTMDGFHLQDTPDLTPNQEKQINCHPEAGAMIVGSNPALSAIAKIIAAHHERYDGEGYPLKLSGKEIPLEARIIKLADEMDAATSKDDRPYRKPVPLEKEMRILPHEAGKRFDPEVVDAFLQIRHEIMKKFYDFGTREWQENALERVQE